MRVISRGEIVCPTKGHDQGIAHYVLRTEGELLYLVDGKNRPVKAPKKKRQLHVISKGIWIHPVTVRIQEGEPVLDSEIRRALAVHRDEFSDNQGGMTLGEKRHD